MPDNQNQFGEWLRRWRKEFDMTQDEVGKAVGKTKQHISNLERQQEHYETGGFARPGIDLVDKLAKLFRRPISEARDIAGYGLKEEPSPPAESIEETLRYAQYFKGKGLSERGIEAIRPFLEALDKQVELLAKEEK